jgi:hypothetical protein
LHRVAKETSAESLTKPVSGRWCPAPLLQQIPFDSRVPIERNYHMPFGFEVKSLRSLVLLDKSYLQAVSRAQLEYYCSQGSVVPFVSDVLMRELLRTVDLDSGRVQSLRKLYSVQQYLWVAPAVGEMLRFEAQNREPASLSMRPKTLTLTPEKLPSGELRFTLSRTDRLNIKRRTRDTLSELPGLLAAWRTLGTNPAIYGAKPSEIPAILSRIALAVRNDPALIRQNFANIKHKDFPPPELIDENWAYFRWVQVFLLSGLDYFQKYGSTVEPNRQKVMNERLDLDYTITALLLGSLASCDRTMKERFRFLRPDGRLLPDPLKKKAN